MGVSTISIGNKSVLVVDCANKKIDQIDELKTTLLHAKALIASSEENSVYIITDITGTSFNPEIVNDFCEFALSNTKYINLSVVIGVDESNRIIFNTIKKLTKRDFLLAKNLAEAKKFISSLR